MLAMTTSPSEKNLAHVSLVRQQRELEKEKRAAEKLRSMPDHLDKPTPLFNPPVKKEYNDETAARLKTLLGEPATIAGPTSRHTGRSQQDRGRSLPLQQPLPQPRDNDLPPKRAESPVVTATTRLGDGGSMQGTATRLAAGHSIGLTDGKGMLSTALSAAVAASSSSPCGQSSHPPLPGQATTFACSSESIRPLSPWHDPISAGFGTDSSAALKIHGHVAATSGSSGNCSSAVQDGSSPAHGSIFQKPLPRINGVPIGMKPSIPKLVISDELVDHDVSSILQEMRSLTPLSGINTPRKEMSMIKFPLPGDTKGIVQAESSTVDLNKPSVKTSDNEVLAELITSDTDESDKSDAEESHSSSGHSTSDTDDDTSQSHDSDSDDDGNGRGSAESSVIPRDRSSRPPEVFPSFSNASHGAHSGESWSLEALEQHSRSKVETPPLELSGLACSTSRGKQLPTDRPVPWPRVLEEPSSSDLPSPLPSSHEPSTSMATANESSPCSDIVADVNETSQCLDDVIERGSVNHVAEQNISSDSHSPPKKPLSPEDGDDTDDEDITVDIESVSPPSQEKTGPRQDTAPNRTHISCSAAGDPLSSNVRETQSVADLITTEQPQPNLCPDELDSQGCEVLGDIGTTVKHEVSISTSTVTTTSEVEQSLVESSAPLQALSRLASNNVQPLTVRSPEHMGILSLVVSKSDQPLTVVSPESTWASSPVMSKNDQPLTAGSLESMPSLSLVMSKNDGSPDSKRTSQLVFKNDHPLSTGSPEIKRTARLASKNGQPLTVGSPDLMRTSSLLASKNDQPLTARSAETKQTLHLAPKNDQLLPAMIADRSDETVGPLSLVVQFPLNLINRLPVQHVQSKNVHTPSPAPSQSKNRSRYSSTSSSTGSDKYSSSIAEHDEIVKPAAAVVVATAVKDKLDRPKNGSTTDRVSTDKAVPNSHSSKRKNVIEQDVGISRKKSRSSKKDDAETEAKSSNITKESKKGPAKTVASVPTPSQSDRSNDACSANKKRRTGEQPAHADTEADKAHGSVKSGSNSSGSRHADLPVRPPGPALAPPSIPAKSAGPSYTNGLPPRASSVLSSDIDTLPEYSRSPDVYLPEAKRLKHKADLCGDMLQKYLTYLESIHMFLLCARAIERDSPTNITQIYKMYLETYRLLSHIHKHKHSKPVDPGVWAILSLWTQSLLCQKLYKLSRPDNEKHHKVVEQFLKDPISNSVGIAQSSVSSLGHVKNHGSPASPAPSPSGSVASTSSLTSENGNGTSGKTGVVCTPPRQPTNSTSSATHPLAAGVTPTLPGIVPMPIKTYTSMKGYAQTVRLLEMCHHWWDQADMLVLEEKNRAFFTHVEEHVPPLTLHSSIIHLAHYLKVAVKSLRKMPEPASSAGQYS